MLLLHPPEMPGMLLVAGRVLFTFFLCTQSRTAHPPPKTNPSDTTSQSQQAEDTLQANTLPFPHRDTTEKLPLQAEAFRRARESTRHPTGQHVALSSQRHHRKASLASRGFQEGSGKHEQGCGMQEHALPRLGAAGRRQRRAGSARNKRGSSQGKRGPARGTRG